MEAGQLAHTDQGEDGLEVYGWGELQSTRGQSDAKAPALAQQE